MPVSGSTGIEGGDDLGRNMSATDSFIAKTAARSEAYEITGLEVANGAVTISTLITSFARTILDDVNAAAVRATIGVGTGDALKADNLDQFADVTQTATKTLAITDNTTLNGGTHSGTNTGDQTITLTGNVTGSGTGSFAATIANDAVTLAKMADMATASLIYRKTAGTGDPEVQTLTTLKADLGLTGTNTGDTSNAELAVTLASDNLPLSGVTIASALPWLIYAVVTSESGTSDTITTIDTADAAPDGSVIILRSETGHTITLNDNSALRCEHAEDMELVPAVDTATFIKSGAASWRMVAHSKNVRKGDTVTQATSRTTAVTIDADYGRIVTDTTSLAAGSSAKFTVNNSRVGPNDLVDVCIKSGSTTDRTSVKVNAVTSGTFNVVVENFHASTAETGAINIHFRRHPGAVA